MGVGGVMDLSHNLIKFKALNRSIGFGVCVSVCGRSLFHTPLQHEGGAARTSTCMWSVWVPPRQPPHPLGLVLCAPPATPQQQQQLSPSSCCFPDTVEEERDLRGGGGVRATPPRPPTPHPPHRRPTLVPRRQTGWPVCVAGPH